MNFYAIITNPPFQDTTRRGKTPHKLWIDFTLAVFHQYLADGGLLCQVSPSSFRSPNSVVLDLMKEHHTPVVRFDTGEHFPTVGSTFADYQIWKQPNDGNPSRISVNGDAFLLRLDHEVAYLPNDLTSAGLAVHRKVMFHPERKLDVRWDYVACHNIRLRDVNSTLSRTRTPDHPYKVFHTNGQIWWSAIVQDWATKRKVMWTRSGYTKPFYDTGTMGGTDMAYYVLVDSDRDGENLAHNLNLMLMRYIYQTAKWSGFGNERVFASLPHLPTHVSLTDDQLFELFALTGAEVAHVRAIVDPPHPRVRGRKPAGDLAGPLARRHTYSGEGSDPALWAEVARRMDEHDYMNGVERTVERVRATGEVFTPTSLVVEMLADIPIETFAPGRTILDPACGDGQFLVGTKWVKVLAHGMSESSAVDDLYGIDIMRENVDLCRLRLGGGTIVMGNALHPGAELEGQTQTERDTMRAVFGERQFEGPVKKAAFHPRKPRALRRPTGTMELALDLRL